MAQRLRLPTIVGFLIAGLAIGPNTPGPVIATEDIEKAADLGVILLMFGVGMHLSFRQLIEQSRRLIVSGTVQIGLTIALALVAAMLLGLGTDEALVLGFLVSISSTMVAVKVLESRQETRTVHAIAAINVLVFQDLAAVVMVIIVPALGGGSFDAAQVLYAMGKGVLLIAVAYVLSAVVLPGLWQLVAHTRSRELSMLAALTLAVGLAAGSGLLGLSIAFGAFLAGLAVSENAYGHASLSDVIPLRDVFASVFFVLIGMLAEPKILWHEPHMVVSILLVVVAGKTLASTIALRAVRLSVASSLLAGLLLAQVGEFSFVIARTAVDEGVIDNDLEASFLAAAILSILLSPIIVRLGPWMLMWSRRLPFLGGAFDFEPDLMQSDRLDALRRHVVICGYGGAAAALARSLSGRNLPFVVIENNPFIFERVRPAEPDLAFIYGDATRQEVLEAARVSDARILAITFPNAADVLQTVTNARIINPGIDVVARGTLDTHVMLRAAGSSEVVDPEFEASLEFVRHVLHRFGVDAREIGALQVSWRSEYYGSR